MQLLSQMEQGTLTSEQLTVWYLSRIERYDRGENGLNSVLEQNPDALFQAKECDRERAQGRLAGPLHGIPILIKDNLNTADQMHTSAGSLALAGSRAAEDAEIVRRLRQAGAVLLGKTNMTEFANYISMENMPNGYSSRGGQVFHPYGRQFDPSGSSTGSGVAVSANFCSVAVGTDTCASVYSPAQSNGIVGLRPSVGSVSQQGILPICDTLDTAGPMARTVEDAALLYHVMADPEHKILPFGGIKTFFAQASLSGKRIGVCRAKKMCESEEALFQKVLSSLQELGAQVSELPQPQARFTPGDIMKYEFKRCMDAYLAALPQFPLKALEDLMDYNRAHAHEALRYGQGLFEEALECAKDENGYRRVLQAVWEDRKRAYQVLESYDAVLLSDENTDLGPYLNCPEITVPCGLRANGAPQGLFLIAKPYEEATLLQMAYAMEQGFGKRVPPDLEKRMLEGSE